MSSSLSPDEEAGFARFEEEGPSIMVPAAAAKAAAASAASATATAAHPAVNNLHPHTHPAAPAPAAGFGSDPITCALGNVSLDALNAAPASHAAALQQLELAKLYIARSQRWHASKRARFASRSGNDKMANAKSFNKATGNAPTAAARTGGGGFAREDSLLPYGSADEWDESDYTDDDGSDDGDGANGMELQTSPSMDDLQAHLHASGHVPEMSPDDYYAMPWYKLLAKRLPWLVVLLLLQSFGALIMNHYDDLLSKHLVLNFFIPMMQGTSGNAGNQVRAESKRRDWRRRREQQRTRGRSAASWPLCVWMLMHFGCYFFACCAVRSPSPPSLRFLRATRFTPLPAVPLRAARCDGDTRLISRQIASG